MAERFALVHHQAKESRLIHNPFLFFLRKSRYCPFRSGYFMSFFILFGMKQPSLPRQERLFESAFYGLAFCSCSL